MQLHYKKTYTCNVTKFAESVRLQVAPALLQHPSTSVRAAAVDFVCAAAAFLTPPDVYAHLTPLLTPALTAEPASLTSQSAIVEQLPKQLQQGILDRSGPGTSEVPSVGFGARRAPGSFAASDASASSVSSLRRTAVSPNSGRPRVLSVRPCDRLHDSVMEYASSSSPGLFRLLHPLFYLFWLACLCC